MFHVCGCFDVADRDHHAVRQFKLFGEELGEFSADEFVDLFLAPRVHHENALAREFELGGDHFLIIALERVADLDEVGALQLHAALIA